jgi:serine/threonine protein kinase
MAPEIIKRAGYGEKIDNWSIGVIAYILLSGYVPFNEDDPYTLFEEILVREIEFPSPEWDNISSDAKDFIRRCLHKDPKDRLSLDGMLNHPWITNEKEIAYLHSQTNLRRFNTLSKIRRCGVNRKVLGI